ncbi:hypothetical protein EDC96DRAFT_435658, partial [Choanephora cucurbitarum]
KISEYLACRANQRWRDKGETSVRFLKELVQKRQNSERIQAFRDVENEEPRSGSDSMLNSAHLFYQQLYTVDPVNAVQLEDYLNDVAAMTCLKDEGHGSLLEPITMDDIIATSAKIVFKQSSPGSEGFGYAFLHHLYRFPPPRNKS